MSVITSGGRKKRKWMEMFINLNLFNHCEPNFRRNGSLSAAIERKRILPMVIYIL
jgi:hypothetical protein